MNGRPRLLIGSPVHQDKSILKEFLTSLCDLDIEGLDVGYLFIDDNIDDSSSKLLEDFCNRHQTATVISRKSGDLFQCNDEIHQWTENLINKVVTFKNLIIRHAIDEKYDYLFFH